MGLAASQARILLLTARKSDLEYRAQMITHKKTLLAMQSETVSTAYSDAINNTRLHFTYASKNTANSTVTEMLTYTGLTSSSNAAKYRVVDRYGNVCVTDFGADLKKYTGTVQNWYYQKQEKKEAWNLTYIIPAKEATEGQEATPEQHVTVTINSKEDADKYKAEGAKYSPAEGESYDIKEIVDNPTYVPVGEIMTTTDAATIPANAADGSYTYNVTTAINPIYASNTDALNNSISESYTTDWAEILNNTEGFQNALLGGQLFIQQYSEEGFDKTDNQGNYVGTVHWATISIAGNNMFSQKYYTEDDPVAEREYENATLRIQNADKRLDVELQQIQAQQKACESEIESVKNLIKSNVESSYKIFS